jgi:hypothetical protein
MINIVFIISHIIKGLIMSNSIRSDSYSESVRQGLHPLTTTPIVPQRRPATTGNINRRPINYPVIHIQRASIDINSSRLNTLPKGKPPREVSLRVKFIRLGEVRFSIHLYLFVDI